MSRYTPTEVFHRTLRFARHRGGAIVAGRITIGSTNVLVSSSAIARLERLGLVKLHSFEGGRRVFRLTPDGVAAAEMVGPWRFGFERYV